MTKKKLYNKKIIKSDLNKENLIHIRLEYGEAIKVKKDILSLQMSLLNIMKRIIRYREYRTMELELKSRLYRRIKDAKATSGNLQKTLPKMEIPEILRKEHRIFHQKIEKKKDKAEENFEVQDMDIEGQLMEIQRRLNELQSEESLIS